MNFSVLFNNIFCKHDNELVNQFEMTSEFDIIVSNNRIPNSFHNTQRFTVTDYKCKKMW